jgi:hypothetical protein
LRLGHFSDVSGFTFTGGDTLIFSAIQIMGNFSEVKNNVFLANTGTVTVGGEGLSPTITGNTFSQNTCDKGLIGGTIALFGNTAPTVSNNLIHNNTCTAITMQTTGNATHSITNNTLVNNEQGIDFGPTLEPENKVVRNNIVIGNDVGLNSQDSTLSTIENNLFFNNERNYTSDDLTGLNGNISVDPQFVNLEGNNFHLTTGSPAINSGSSTDAPTTDLDGKPRNDGKIDMGAFEFSNPACATESVTNQFSFGNKVQYQLRALRDNQLKNSETGQQLTGLYYKHSAELKTIMKKDWVLKLQGLQILLRTAYAYHSGKDDLVPFNRYYSSVIERFISRAKSKGVSIELENDLHDISNILGRMRGLTVQETLLELQH